MVSQEGEGKEEEKAKKDKKIKKIAIKTEIYKYHDEYYYILVIYVKTPKIDKSKAVAVLVIAFLLAIPTVSAGGLLIRQGFGGSSGDEWNEEPNFPADVPENRTSLTSICARRAWDIWNRHVYDVGFALYVMRRCDGEMHAWNFVGTIVTRYDDENGPVEETEYSRLMFWDSETSIGFDIVIGGVHTEPVFYTKTLTGMIYSDGDAPPRDYSRTFYGRDFLGNSNVNEVAAISEVVASGGTGSPVPR